MSALHVDRFMLGAGIVQLDGQFPPKAHEALLLFVEDFLEAGGVLSWDDWVSMSLETRAAFVLAARRLRRGGGEVANEPSISETDDDAAVVAAGVDAIVLTEFKPTSQG